MIFVVKKYGNFSLYLKKTSNKTVVMATAWQVSFCSPFDLDWWCQVWRSLHEYFQRYYWISICAFLISQSYDIIMLLICIIQKRQYLQNEKRYSKKENTVELYIEKPFKQATKIFHVIYALKEGAGTGSKRYRKWQFQNKKVVYKASCWDCHDFYIGRVSFYPSNLIRVKFKVNWFRGFQFIVTMEISINFKDTL